MTCGNAAFLSVVASATAVSELSGQFVAPVVTFAAAIVINVPRKRRVPKSSITRSAVLVVRYIVGTATPRNHATQRTTAECLVPAAPRAALRFGGPSLLDLGADFELDPLISEYVD
jgi:hypothetical protein